MTARHAVPRAAFVILRRGDEVLLMRRCNTGYEDGKYDFPAGHVEANEHPSETALREITEETGVAVQAGNLFPVYVLSRKENPPVSAEYMNIFFTTSLWKGEPTIMEPTKCDDLGWFPLTALPANIVPSSRDALEAILRGETYGEGS